ncbi:MAG: 5-formyltetrahydrofolate cyclo-ligase [Clostridia bacterium]
MESKEGIRKRILDIRGRMTPEDRGRKSKIIGQKLQGMGFYKKAAIIMGYMDFRNEVMMDHILKEAKREGKRILLPICVPRDRSLLIAEVSDFERDLRPGAYGIQEPRLEHASLQIDPKEIDIIIVPGVAFDPKGCRIGYGAGYYDRFLACLSSKTLKLGLAFQEQIVSHIPADNHDIAMDIIITDKHVYECTP